MSLRIVSMSEAETHFGRIAAAVNATGESVTVFRDSKPWVEIRPLAAEAVAAEAPSAEVASSGLSLPRETLEAIEQAEEMLADARHERFATIDELFEDLGI